MARDKCFVCNKLKLMSRFENLTIKSVITALLNARILITTRLWAIITHTSVAFVDKKF